MTEGCERRDYIFKNRNTNTNTNVRRLLDIAKPLYSMHLVSCPTEAFLRRALLPCLWTGMVVVIVIGTFHTLRST